MGTTISEGHIQLVHGNNLYILYRFLDYAKVTDRNGNAVRLSEVIQKANNLEKVSYIIEIFNTAKKIFCNIALRYEKRAIFSLNSDLAK